MGCNCGSKNQVVKKTFTFTSTDGRTVRTGLTDLEARAAKIRAGGGTIKPTS